MAKCREIRGVRERTKPRREDGQRGVTMEVVEA